jgi:cell division protein FtsQ
MKKTNTKDNQYKKGGAKRRARARRIRRFFFVLVIGTAIVLFALSSFFNVQKINVQGNKKYQTNDIIMRVGLVPGQNIFKMLGRNTKDLFTFRFNREQQTVYSTMPYIKTVSIRPSLPKEISVQVTERTPYCLVEVPGTSLLIDDQGYALEDGIAGSKLFTIKGSEISKYKLGQAVQFKQKGILDDIKKLSTELIKSDKDSKLKLYDKVKWIDISEVNCYTVNFDSRVTVKFGDIDNIKYKIGFFREVYVNNINKQKGLLDFTKGNNPFFVAEE